MRLKSGDPSAHEFDIQWNGATLPARPGETILGALIANDIHTLRTTRFGNAPRGMLCGMGVCYECLVTVDGMPNRRACMTLVEEGMDITSGGTADITGTE